MQRERYRLTERTYISAIKFPCLPWMTDASHRELDVSFGARGGRLFLDGVYSQRARLGSAEKFREALYESGGSLARPISNV